MAIAPDSAATDLTARNFDAASLLRTASWGIGAAAALFLAALAGLSDPGASRVTVALATVTGNLAEIATTAAPARVADIAQPPSQPRSDPELNRLNEQVRLLAADRDRLVQRIGMLEQNLEDVTGSIRQQQAAAAAPASAEPPVLPTPAAAIAVSAAPWPALPPEPPTAAPWNEPPLLPRPAATRVEQPVEPPPETTASLPPATPLPPRRPAIAPPAAAGAPAAKPEPVRQVVARPETPRTYGVDLGGAVSVDRLRLLWNSLRTHEPRLLQGLRPITHTREARRGGRPDVRLIAGPLPSADEAARLCGAILNAGRYCEPALFGGQRLTVR